MNVLQYSRKKKISLFVSALIVIIVALVFMDVIPIGYKHVTIPEDKAYNGLVPKPYHPELTCDTGDRGIVKLNYHVKAERDLYNAEPYSSICPTYSVTKLLYW